MLMCLGIRWRAAKMPILIQLWGAAGEAAFLPYSHVMPALWVLEPHSEK